MKVDAGKITTYDVIQVGARGPCVRSVLSSSQLNFEGSVLVCVSTKKAGAAERTVRNCLLARFEFWVSLFVVNRRAQAPRPSREPIGS